jgi:hypothetical protein
LKAERVAFRENDRVTQQNQETQNLQTNYQLSYTPYRYVDAEKCPKNQFYNDCEYTQSSQIHSQSMSNFESMSPRPKTLIELQDGWSKSDAKKRFSSAHPGSRTVDRRQNVYEGKKQIKDSPLNAAKYSNIY